MTTDGAEAEVRSVDGPGASRTSAVGRAIGFVADHAAWGLAVAVALLLLAPDSTYLLVPQLDLMRVAVVVAAVPLAFAWRRAVLRPTPADVFALSFLAIATCGWILGAGAENPRLFVAVLLPFAFYFLGRVGGGPDSMRVLVWTLAGCGALGALIVLFEYVVVREPLVTDEANYYWNAGEGVLFRPGGLYGSPPGAALIFSMTAFAALYLTLATRDRLRWVATACLAVTVAALVVTFSRGSYVGLAVALAGFALLTLPRTFVRRTLWVVAAAVALFGLSLPLWVNSDLFQEGLLRPSTFDYRLGNWELAFDALNSPAQLALGEGFNALLLARPVYGAVPASPDLLSTSLLVTDGPHNQYLLVLLELGLVGVAALLGWFVATVTSGVRDSMSAARRDHRLLVAALSMAVVAYAVACLFGDHFRFDTSVAIVALIAGLTVSCAGWRSDETAERAVKDR